MLTLSNITKDYAVADSTVNALRGVSISFRKSEFVSILGPSGCGKTTLLNIIGGLDKYTSGEMYIDGTSTREFSDRDWDTYRNHRIGFIFQSYNLIPHQTILENVELALTIAGIGKEERITRAKDALDKVGLSGQYNKKPNQLSGGQCQRVAIARALVNEPEILLADEPTGALDTVTSVQIMELIKEISKERLVIMVTHNPELAEKYSTRIIRLLDGNVVEDTKPYKESKTSKEKSKPVEREQKSKERKSKLGLWTAFKLSARNLRSKFKRTLMVCLAGSIGIIGVATVLAVSTGVTGFIGDMQDDMLSGNPITINEESINLSALMGEMSKMSQADAVAHSIKDGYVNVDYLLEYLISQKGDVTSFKINNKITEQYLDFLRAMPKEYYNALALYYGVDVGNNIYTDIKLLGSDGTLTSGEHVSLNAIKTIYTEMLKQTKFKEYSGVITTLTNTFAQAPNNEQFILSQYDIISNPSTSKVATEADEIMIVLNQNNALTDLLLAQLGYYDQNEFFNIINKLTKSENYDSALDKEQFSYDELLGKSFTWYPNDTVFNQTPSDSPLATLNPFTYNAYANDTWTTGMPLKITAILRPKENISYGSLQTGFYYTEALTQKIITEGATSQIVNYLAENEKESFTSTANGSMNVGIIYDYHYYYDTYHEHNVGFAGQQPQQLALAGFMGNADASNIFVLSSRHLGGKNLPSDIAIYPVNFDQKDNVTKYLDKWNSTETLTIGDQTITADQREDVIYADNLAIVIDLINNMVNIVTYALVAFTALSLIVSTVMIAIITYVSVIERVKEIGVIRSLGGRKKDVSRLFIAETFIIGALAGIIGIIITYLLCVIINAIVGSLTGIYTIATLPIYIALIMITISIVLTLISGLIPARLAAKKDPVIALRSE